jgi:hypothetical protein
LPGGGRTEKTAQRLLGKFSKDVFLFARGASDRKGFYHDNRKTRQGGEAASAALKSFFFSRDEKNGMETSRKGLNVVYVRWLEIKPWKRKEEENGTD